MKIVFQVAGGIIMAVVVLFGCCEGAQKYQKQQRLRQLRDNISREHQSTSDKYCSDMGLTPHAYIYHGSPSNAYTGYAFHEAVDEVATADGCQPTNASPLSYCCP